MKGKLQGIVVCLIVSALCAPLGACQGRGADGEGTSSGGVSNATSDAANGSGGSAASSDAPSEDSPLLDWEGLERYWVTDSSDRPMGLNDDSLPGDGGGRSWALRGASRVGEAGAWNIEAIDCSTGDVSYWVAADETAGRLSETSPDDLLGGDLVCLDGGRWRFFDNYPRARSDVEREAEDYVMDHEQGILFEVDSFNNADERMRRAIVHSADGNLRDALVVMYGADEIRGYEGE